MPDVPSPRRPSSSADASPLEAPARGVLRDWALFAAAALGPAIAVGVLGLRALANEEAGARREAALSLAAAAQQAARRVEDDLGHAERSLAAIDADPDGLARALASPEARAAIAPAFAEPVMVDRNGTILVPAPPAPAAPAPPAPAACHRHAEAIAAADPARRAEARRSLLAECAEARNARGGFIWPVVALDEIGRGGASAEALAAWIGSHAALLCETEREAMRIDVRESSALSTAQKAAAEEALSKSASRRDAVEDVITGDASPALRSPPDARGLVTWRTGSSRGALHPLPDGRLAGFLVDPGSLARAVDRGCLALPEGLRADVRIGAPSPGAREDRLWAEIAVAPELLIRIAPADPHAVAHKAAKSRTLLAVLGVGATALAFAFAALLFARMRAARRSSELRTDFVSTVSHELRTPIASVRMLAELLAEGRAEPEEQKEIFDALAREARRLGETVDRLLGFSRMAAGRHAVTLSPGSVGEAVSASIDTFEERHADRPKVEREIDPEITAPIDAAQIRLAVDNLLANAAKYAPEGGPYRVRVARDRGGVVIEVTDRGPGVARRDQARIFEPFERADDRLSHATEGSGIGLSLVRFVAKAHGGRAGVQSEIGRGATFYVWIPGGNEERAR
jgi:signal transduction histidine kinase